MDTMVMVVTGGVLVAMLGIVAIGCFMAGFGPGLAMRGAGAFIIVIGLVIPISSYLWSPTGYLIRDQSFVIERPIGEVEIAIQSIETVEPLEQLGPTFRKFGNGGLFGVYGKFSSKQLGNFDLYARQNGGMVLIKTPTQSVVVSPGRRDEFIAELRERAGTLH